MKNKKLTIGLATTAAFAILGLSAFALFTARDDSDFIAKAGTVDIEVDDIGMTNADNINPGDNDPANPEDAVAGTEHVFEYTVSNLGNKSVRTRHTIILTALDGEDASLLDARFLGLFKNDHEIGVKTFVLEDGTEISNLDTLKDDDVITAVKYVFMGDVFDGFGESIANGGSAEKEALADVVRADEITNEVSRTYYYDFGLLRQASNIYQAADFKIDVIIEAMQYRNTTEEDWETVSTVTRTFSTADVEGLFVPNRDEDSQGNKLDEEFLDNATTPSVPEEDVEQPSEETPSVEEETPSVEEIPSIEEVPSEEEIPSDVPSEEVPSEEEIPEEQPSENE